MKRLMLSILMCVCFILPASADLTSETYKTIFTGDGATVDFVYDFKVFEAADLAVILYTIADGTETTLTLTTNYTVAGITSAGGTVTTVATYSSAYKIIVKRDQEKVQEIDYTPNSGFSTAVLEKGLDSIVMMIQDVDEEVSRALLRDSSQTTQLTFPLAEASKVIAWNAGATALENVTNPAVAAAASAAAAALSETASETAETNAETAETNAETAETNAETAETNAAASAASINLPTLSGGDALKILEVNTAEDGYDLTRSISTDDTLAGDSDNNIPTEQAVKAYIDGVSSVTGDSAVMITATGQTISAGSTETVLFGTEIYDIGSDFNTDTETFTAPTTGKYLITLVMTLGTIDSASTAFIIRIDASNRDFDLNFYPDDMFSADTTYTFSMSTMMDMDASDTCLIAVNQTGGANQCVIGGTSTVLSITQLF